MYFCYVDESGDPGASPNGSKHYILSALIIPEEEWQPSFNRMKDFRKSLKEHFKLPMRTEIHASELIRVQKLKEYKDIRKADRMKVLQFLLKEMPSIFCNCHVINICFDKAQFPDDTDFHYKAYDRLFNRFNSFLAKKGGHRGIVICDINNEPKLRTQLRKMRVYNPVPSRFGNSPLSKPITQVLEDPIMRDSKFSVFVQACDAIAYSLYLKEYVKPTLKKFGADRFFDYLESILLKEASINDPKAMGIVRK